MVLTSLFPLLLAVAGPVPNVPAPPKGTFEKELTAVAAQKADLEMKAVLAQIDADPSQPADVRKEAREKASRLKVAVYTTTESIEKCVSFYATAVPGALFLFAERRVVPDVEELAAAGGFSVPEKVRKEWEGKLYHYARWSRDDGTLEIDIEDTLIDPRNGNVTARTVVMVTSLAR
jgi:DNA-binding NarL/FixJ family response regulator